MLCRTPSRPSLAAVLLAATLPLVSAPPAHAAPQLGPEPVSQQQRALDPEPQTAQRPLPSASTRIGPQGEHLAQWMSRHQNLPLTQQQRALEQEPGFHSLPPEAQQRMHNRLTELHSMSPERRQRLLARTEAMERLAPEQRQEVRSAMQQLAALPEGRRQLVARAFRDLRTLPPQQRQYAFNTDPRYLQSFTPPERATLGNLLAVEPYLPPPQQRQPVPQNPYPGPVMP